MLLPVHGTHAWISRVSIVYRTAGLNQTDSSDDLYRRSQLLVQEKDPWGLRASAHHRIFDQVGQAAYTAQHHCIQTSGTLVPSTVYNSIHQGWFLGFGRLIGMYWGKIWIELDILH